MLSTDVSVAKALSWVVRDVALNTSPQAEKAPNLQERCRIADNWLAANWLA